MLGIYIGILVLLCFVTLGYAAFVIYLLDKYRGRFIGSGVISILCALLILVSSGLIFAGDTPLYHYKVISADNVINTILEDSNQCQTYGCSGQCISSFAIGTACFADHSKDHAQCTTTCMAYVKKYLAVKTFILQDSDDSNHQIMLKLKSSSLYDTVHAATQHIFPSIIGSCGWSEESTDFSTGNLRWEDKIAHDKEYNIGWIMMIISVILCVVATTQFYNKIQTVEYQILGYDDDDY